MADKGVKRPHFNTSKVPSGVRMNDDVTRMGAPRAEYSLWAHYSYRVDKAVAEGDTDELVKITDNATRDLEVYTRRRPAYHENHEAAVTELLRDCKGWQPIQAARRLGAPAAWVKQQRFLAQCDPYTGEQRALDQRSRRIVELKKSGASVRVIALEVGISTGQVSNILNGRTSSHG